MGNTSNGNTKKARIKLISLITKVDETLIDPYKSKTSSSSKNRLVRKYEQFIKSDGITRTQLDKQLSFKLFTVRSSQSLCDMLSEAPLYNGGNSGGSLNLYTATLLPTIYKDDTNSKDNNKTDFYTNQILKIEQVVQQEHSQIHNSNITYLKSERKKQKEQKQLKQTKSSFYPKSRNGLKSIVSGNETELDNSGIFEGKTKRTIRSFDNTNQLNSSFLTEKLKLNKSVDNINIKESTNVLKDKEEKGKRAFSQDNVKDRDKDRDLDNDRDDRKMVKDKEKDIDIGNYIEIKKSGKDKEISLNSLILKSNAFTNGNVEKLITGQNNPFF